MTEVVGNSLFTPTAVLTAPLTSGATSITVNAWASPLPQTGTFRVRIDNELMTVGSVSGTVLGSLTRGVESTSAVAHGAGAFVDLVLTAGGLTTFVEQNGGSSPGAATVRGPFSFAYNTPSLNNGVAVYTPSVGEWLLDAWVLVDTAWDGTTPSANIGILSDFTAGIFDYALGEVVDLTLAAFSGDAGIGVGATLPNGAAVLSSNSAVGESFDLLQVPAIPSVPSDQSGLVRLAASHAEPGVPILFTAATALGLVVSENGYPGTAPGATQGAARLYLVTATPVAL